MVQLDALDMSVGPAVLGHDFRRLLEALEVVHLLSGSPV